ncbi:hypothetical protein OSB04_029840 [Centaurea solstitialis]|uniref:Reverse transcriptase domain-containing protein n=1 Tax=Centaurea solstitialis TaxID=347529 RepID=A0AA38VW55_9ASTR|nr:hypothetical protein OSB04_029840 [Centaurea solstitialis]
MEKSRENGDFGISKSNQFIGGTIPSATSVAETIWGSVERKSRSATNCLKLAETPVQAPTPATLRITIGNTGKKNETSSGRGRVFQLTAKEAKSAPDVVIGTFLVNIRPTLVLFDSGASRSFVSQSFCKEFDQVLGDLDSPLTVEIADEKILSMATMLKGYVLEIGGVRFVIDLILIVMNEINVKEGRTGVFLVAKVRKYLQHRCVEYLAYVLDNQLKEGRPTIVEVPVVREFPDVFSEDLLGTPLDKQGKLRINLLPGTFGEGLHPSEQLAMGYTHPFCEKKDGSLRMCIDYKELNKGATWFLKIDLHSSYHQLKVGENDVYNTT